MKNMLTALMIALALPTLAFADDATVRTDAGGIVTIASRGLDVREVLHDLFDKAKKNYVFESNVRQQLFLSLSGVEFEEALQIVCSTAGLKYEIQNGIYYITRRPAPVTPPVQQQSQVQTQTQQQPRLTPPANPAPRGKLGPDVLARRVTTRFSKTDFRAVIADIGRQAQVQIAVHADVPAFKVDAFLINTSLKYALDTLAEATNLEVILTDNRTIELRRKNPNRVSVVPQG